MAVGGIARERDLRVLSAAIGLSAAGDGAALVALALQAKNLSGEGMGGGLAIAVTTVTIDVAPEKSPKAIPVFWT